MILDISTLFTRYTRVYSLYTHVNTHRPLHFSILKQNAPILIILCGSADFQAPVQPAASAGSPLVQKNPGTGEERAKSSTQGEAPEKSCTTSKDAEVSYLSVGEVTSTGGAAQRAALIMKL